MQVEHDQVGRVLDRGLKCLRAVKVRCRFVSVARQRLGNVPGELALVFDDVEYTCRRTELTHAGPRRKRESSQPPGNSGLYGPRSDALSSGAPMNILFVGGTGIISTACTELAVARGLKVTLLNRSLRGPVPGARTITADVSVAGAAARELRGTQWDAVVDFISFTPSDVEARLRLFRGKVGQYVFVSSASAYQKPLTHYLITESTPLANPLWDYSRNKIACEERLLKAYRDEGFPVTIIRPSLTYGDTVVPLAVNSWLKGYTARRPHARGRPRNPATGSRSGRSPTTPTSRRAWSGCSGTPGRSGTPSTSPPTRRSRGTSSTG